MSIRLAEPTRCDSCNSIHVKFVPNDEYYGELKGSWPYIWICTKCFACVGCHPGTRTPLGKMADKRTRKLRRDAHVAFDAIWQKGLLNRHHAYVWLANQLNINHEDCHISWLTDDQLIEAKKVSTEFFKQRSIEVRRQAKKNAKRQKSLRDKFERSRKLGHARRFKTVF